MEFLKIKLVLVILGCCLFVSKSTWAQESIVFKFRTGNDGFYRDYKDNKVFITKLFNYIDTNKNKILDRFLYINLTAYSNISNTKDQESASVRARRVKSEMITRAGLKERCFITNIQTSYNDSLINTVIVHLPEIAPLKDIISELPSSDTLISIPKESSPVSNHPEEVSTSDVFRIKNNLVSTAFGVLNLGCEYFLSDHFSADLSFYYSPYTISENYKLRILALQPELRYWLNTSYMGHFIGTHFTLAWFNVAFSKNGRFQDQGGSSPAWGMGLSYGYTFSLGKNWGMEATAGLGYLRVDYDKFYNVDNGAKIESKSYHYFGPTKLGLSLIYRINR